MIDQKIDKLRREDFLLILDQPTKSRFMELYQPFAQSLFNVYFHMYQNYGMKMRCTEGLRTYQQQQDLYDQGRLVPGLIVTNAKPGKSLHNFGLAADSCFIGNDPYLKNSFNGDLIWQAFGQLVLIEELTWGRDIPTLNDKGHVEKSYGLTVGELHDILSYGGLKLVYKEISANVKTIDSTM